MGITLPEKFNSQKQSESSTELLDRRERAPYNTNELIHALFLKYLTAEQKQKLINLATDSPQRMIAITELLDLYTCLFPKPENQNTNSFTAMNELNVSAVKVSLEVRKAQERSNESAWDHLERMTGADGNWLKMFINKIIKGSVNGASTFTALRNKQTQFFSTILRRDHAISTTVTEHARDTIAGPLGVFTGIDSPRLSPEIEGSQIEQICDHNQKATFLMSLLYFQHMSKQSGFFIGAKDQIGLDPDQSQAEAKSALNILLTPDGINRALSSNPLLASELIKLVQSPEFNNLFPTLQGATHDLNIKLAYEPSIDTEYSHFSTTPFTTKGLTNLLDSIPHRIFNGDNSRFADITVAQYLSYPPAELARIIRDSPDTLKWKDIADIESTQISSARWPIFATSMTHEKNDGSSPHTPYTASLGKNMLEMDYRIGENGEVLIHYNESHVVIDGIDTKEYINLVNTVLGRGDTNLDHLILFNAPLYPVKEHPVTTSERFTYWGLSDFILGRTYDYNQASKFLDIISSSLDPVDDKGKSISSKIYEFVKTELINPESIRQILSSLAYEYPQTLSRFSVPDTSTTNPGYKPKVPELVEIDSKDELQVLCLKLRQAYEYESARLKGTASSIPSHYQRLDAPEIAKEVRNNLCPRPSFIHLLDLIIATKRGGVLNCTGMLSKHGRFGLAAVKPIDINILQKKQLSQVEYKAVMNNLILNLNEQSRTRIGHGSPAFLATLTGLTKDLASNVAELLNKTLVRMTGKTIAQSSTLGKSLLQWFITANSAFNDTNGLAIGDIIREDGKTGALTYRWNFVKENVRRAFGIKDTEIDRDAVIDKAGREFEGDIQDTFNLLELLSRGPAQ